MYRARQVTGTLILLQATPDSISIRCAKPRRQPIHHLQRNRRKILQLENPCRCRQIDHPRVSRGSHHNPIRVPQTSREGRLHIGLVATHYRQTNIRLNMIENPVRFENQMRIPSQRRPHLCHRKTLTSRGNQQRPPRPGSKKPRSVASLPGSSLLPQRLAVSVRVTRSFHRSPPKLRKRRDQPTDQRRLTYISSAAAYNDCCHCSSGIQTAPAQPLLRLRPAFHSSETRSQINRKQFRSASFTYISRLPQV